MSSLPYKLSQKAGKDIVDIWQYTAANWSVEQANRYYQLIFDEIAFICANPLSGRSLDNVRKGYRSSKVKSHLIFYRVNKDVIEVIRVLHERMDVPARLRGE